MEISIIITLSIILLIENVAILTAIVISRK